MTESALPKPSRFPSWLLPAGLMTALLIMLLAIVVFAREAGKSDIPPAAGPFALPAALDYAAYDVERSENGSLKLTTGSGQNSASLDITVSANDHIWILAPVTAESIKTPLVVNVIAIPNEVRNYTIHALAFAPAPAQANFDGPFIPLADGFAGYEPSRETAERVVVSALLESFDGRNGVTRTSTGPGTLYIDPGAKLLMLRAGSAADIHPGDRLAIHLGADGKPDVSRGILVTPGTGE